MSSACELIHVFGHVLDTVNQGVSLQRFALFLRYLCIPKLFFKPCQIHSLHALLLVCHVCPRSTALTALPNGHRKQAPASGHCVEHGHCKRRECRLLIRAIKPGRVRRTGQNARRIALNGNGARVCAGLDRTDFYCHKRRKVS